MNKVTVVILTHNDEATLAKTIESTKALTSVKRIIIDDHSTDATASIAKQYRIPFITLNLDNDFAAHRNRALSKAPTDWVLFLDSDEVLTPQLCTALNALPNDPPISAYRMRRVDTFWKTTIAHGEAGTVWVTRLVNRNRGKYVRPVHEVWEPDGATESLAGELHHYPHPTIAEFLEHVNRYSTIEANYRARTGRAGDLVDVVVTPIAKFMYTYFIRQGFRDGPAGFVYSFMMSFHSFLVRAKLYQHTDTTPLWQE